MPDTDPNSWSLVQTIVCPKCGAALWSEELGSTLRHHRDGTHTYIPPKPQPEPSS